MSTPGVPSWGCPWHGLIRDWVLTLPNGKTMTFPQSLSGDTTLIEIPGLPAPENTEADATAGRQWWPRAILSGGRLHGHTIGTDAWIYIDPGLRPWHVRVESIVDGQARVTLSRFGALGGQSEQYLYFPSFDRDAGGQGDVKFVHATPTGSKAVFVISKGWVEFSLSGPASNCVIDATVVRNASEAAGIVSETNEQPVSVSIRRNENMISPPPDLEIESWYEGYEGDDNVAGYNGRRLVESILSGRVLSMYYVTGTLSVITVDVLVRADEMHGFTYEIGGRGYYKGTAGEAEETSFATLHTLTSLTETREGVVRLYRDGVLVVAERYAWDRTYSRDYQESYYSGVGGHVEGPRTTTTENNYEYSSGASGADFVEPTISRVDGTVQALNWRTASDENVTLTAGALSLSNVLQVPYSAYGGTNYIKQALLPGGVDAVDIARQGSVYGSWCPVTDLLSIDNAPVCYT